MGQESSEEKANILLNQSLPASLDAEKAVLGSILTNPQFIDLLEGSLEPQFFFSDAHKKIFEVFLDLSQLGKAIDILTVSNALKGGADGEAYSGYSYLIDLTDCAPVAENVEYYAEIVRSKYHLRCIVLSCRDTIKQASNSDIKLEDLIENVEKEFLEITSSFDKGGILKADAVLESTLEEIQEKLEAGDIVSGVPSGFNEIDHLLGGFQSSDLIIMAARPGMGKTALALNIAANAAFAKKSVVLFTLEMSQEQLMARVLSAVSRIDSAGLTKGSLNEEEQDRLMVGARKIHEFKDYLGIDETPGISLGELRSRCRRYHKENGIDLIIIDYLQLMSGQVGANDSREREISKISMGLKALAKELNVPVIALAQLNRGPDARPDKRPKISDLRESGSMEQDADLIFFVYRDEYYYPDSEDAGLAEVIVGKNRHGGLATIKLAFQPKYVSFQNLFNE